MPGQLHHKDSRDEGAIWRPGTSGPISTACQNHVPTGGASREKALQLSRATLAVLQAWAQMKPEEAIKYRQSGMLLAVNFGLGRLLRQDPA